MDHRHARALHRYTVEQNARHAISVRTAGEGWPAKETLCRDRVQLCLVARRIRDPTAGIRKGETGPYEMIHDRRPQIAGPWRPLLLAGGSN